MKNNTKGRVIFHIDMNAFFCSVEEIKDPTLRGKAFAIGRKESLKGVISTASYEARKHGIHSAMPLTQAYKLLPSLLVIDSDYKAYVDYHYKFINLVKEYTDKIEVASIDECYADMTDTIDQIHPMVLARLIQYRLLNEYNLPSSIGIGPTLFYAKMASDMKKPLGLTVIRKKEKEKILYPLSVKDIYGVGKKTFPILIDNGINTIGDFMNPINKDKILKLVGDNTYDYVYNAVMGNTSNVVDPNRYSESQSISTSETFDIYKTSLIELLVEARRMLREIYQKLIKEDYLAKSLILTLRDDQFKTISRRKTLNDYSIDLLEFNNMLLDLLNEYFVEGKSYRLIGVGFSSLIKKTDLEVEYNLFNLSNDDKKEEIEKIMNEFNTKYKDDLLIWYKNKR